MIRADEILAARVLIVDDLEANVQLLEGTLRRAGYTSIARTTDPRAVCAMHRAHRYDLILLDLQMPEMDGFAVMDALRAVEGDGYLPVLVLTAQPGHKLRALQAGARDFVSKPFDLVEVLTRVRNQLEVRLLHEKVVRYGHELEARNRFIRETFGRYLSDDVVERLLSAPGALALGGERRTVTMMMADLRGYTALAEALPPEHVVTLLNRYLEAMIEVITAHGGTLNDFTGDGFLAVFGAPVLRPDDARRAVACAVAMQLAMSGVNARNGAEGLPPVAMGVGINTGDVVVGNIGSAQRAKYGVVGSAVNLTARVESYTTGGQVMLSQATLDAVGDYVDTEPRIVVEPKGASAPLAIHPLVGVRGRPELTLPRVRPSRSPPQAPLGVRFAVLEGKDARGDKVVGRITGLSRDDAEIEAPGVVAPFADLKLQLVSGGDEVDGDLYAKVQGEGASAGRFVVRFTSVPPRVASFLDGVRRDDPAHDAV